MPVKKLPPLSEDVRALLMELLYEFKISARHPQFDTVAALVSKTKAELDSHAT
jgi:hypothetical protein